MARKKKVMLITICIILFSSFIKVEGEEIIVDDIIFMGKVVEVLSENSDNNIKIKMQGFIKNCDVYPEEIIGIITEDTKFIEGNCGETAVKKTNIQCYDIVYVKFSNIMTMSIPPQSVIEEIQISTIKE